VCASIKSGTKVGDAQVPHYQEGISSEAFTFRKLAFPPLPNALDVPLQSNFCGINAAAAGAGGAGQSNQMSAKGKESYDFQEDEQEAGNPGGSSSSKRAREDTPHVHTKGSTKQARVSGVCHAYELTNRVYLARIWLRVYILQRQDVEY